MEIDKIKVVFAIPTLSAGGAERVMSYVAQNLDKEKFETILLVIGNKDGAAYNVDGINVIFLDKNKVRDSFIGVYNFLKKNRPNLVISAISHLNTMMAIISIFFPRIKFVGRETLVKSVTQSTKKKFFINNDTIQKYLLDGIICQSKDMKIDMIQNFDFPKRKLTTIHNPVNEKFHLKSCQSTSSFIKFVTVGRLSKNKGHIRILNALAKFSRPYIYTIIGQGDYKHLIVERAKELGIFSKIIFIDFTDEIPYHLQNNDIFLHGSFVEGFPNSMLESCAVGTPVVAFDAPGGINEIIISGVNGFIAKNEDEFIQYIYEVNSKKFLTPAKIRKSVVERYSADKIINDYEIYIERMIKK